MKQIPMPKNNMKHIPEPGSTIEYTPIMTEPPDWCKPKKVHIPSDNRRKTDLDLEQAKMKLIKVLEASLDDPRGIMGDEDDTHLRLATAIELLHEVIEHADLPHILENDIKDFIYD
jgi:hypothetical protein